MVDAFTKDGLQGWQEALEVLYHLPDCIGLLEHLAVLEPAVSRVMGIVACKAEESLKYSTACTALRLKESNTSWPLLIVDCNEKLIQAGVVVRYRSRASKRFPWQPRSEGRAATC